MKKEVFCPVCTLCTGDNFLFGFYETEAEAWDRLKKSVHDDKRSFAVRSFSIDLFDGESLGDAFSRYDRYIDTSDPDRYARLLLWFLVNY